MKNNKGILIPETLKIIIAVISISLLVYLAVSLYGIFTQNTKLEQAKTSLDNVLEKIESMEKNKIVEGEVLLESPNGWWVIAWPYGEDKRKPKQCTKDYCICLCPVAEETLKDIVMFWSNEHVLGDVLNECDNLGVCKDVFKITRVSDRKNSGPIIIEPGLSLKISLLENEIWITDDEYFKGSEHERGGGAGGGF